MRLLLMGPPGAGKGTQGIQIAEHLGIPLVSTGDIFRAGIAAGTPLGMSVKRYLEAGERVPDDVVEAMVRERLSSPDCADGFVLDGYPRTRDQAEHLDTMLADLDAKVDAVIVLAVPTDELIQRLLRRAGEHRRVDDTTAAIRRRHLLYVEETAPVVDDYEARGLVARVDGTGRIDEVAGRIEAVVSELRR